VDLDLFLLKVKFFQFSNTFHFPGLSMNIEKEELSVSSMLLNGKKVEFIVLVEFLISCFRTKAHSRKRT
jgi:hypothetical protein